jgi:hypothetical protein
MKVRKGLITLAAGAILATTAAAYSAPAQNYYTNQNERQERMGRNDEQRGYALIRRGEQLERTGHWQQGKELERRGHALVKEGERLERLGQRHER